MFSIHKYAEDDRPESLSEREKPMRGYAHIASVSHIYIYIVHLRWSATRDRRYWSPYWWTASIKRSPYTWLRLYINFLYESNRFSPSSLSRSSRSLIMHNFEDPPIYRIFIYLVKDCYAYNCLSLFSWGEESHFKKVKIKILLCEYLTAAAHSWPLVGDSVLCRYFEICA